MNKHDVQEYMLRGEELCRGVDKVDKSIYDEYGVKLGLRDINGHGVLTGVTNISKIISSKMIDGKEVHVDGEL